MDRILENVKNQLLRKKEIRAQKTVDVVLLDKGCPVMCKDAFRLWPATGKIEKLLVDFPPVDEYAELGEKKRPEAVISLDGDGEDLVVFHETRPNTKTKRPNGIQVNYDNLASSFAVFVNAGREPLTVEGNWLEPGKFEIVQDVEITRPDVQRALDELSRSKEVLEEVERIRQEMRKKQEMQKKE